MDNLAHVFHDYNLAFILFFALLELVVVLWFKFHQNRLSCFGAVRLEICQSPLTWQLAYTTACTTVQAVIYPPYRTCAHSITFIQSSCTVCAHGGYHYVSHKALTPVHSFTDGYIEAAL